MIVSDVLPSIKTFMITKDLERCKRGREKSKQKQQKLEVSVELFSVPVRLPPVAFTACGKPQPQEVATEKEWGAKGRGGRVGVH